MVQTAGDVFVETLLRWGVDTVFGIPGDGINGVIEALRTRQDRIRFVQTRHEEAAAFMACAYAKWTGRLGVCLATSGPGGIHLLNGLYDAKMDGAPVLAITGLQFHDLVSTHTQQDVELDKLFMDVAVYNARIMGPAHVENVVELACRSALARRGVAHVTIPADVQSEPAKGGPPRSERNLPHHEGGPLALGAGVPSEDQVRLAAAILNAAQRPCILAGQGAFGAALALTAVAARLGAPVATALLGKGVIPDDSPFATGGVGLLGTRPSQEALENCDALLIAGSCFPYIEFYPKPGQARGVQIDVDPQRIGLRYPVEAALVGDARRSLEALLPHLERKEDRSFLTTAQEGMTAWREQLAAQAEASGRPMKPQTLGHELAQLLPANAIVAADCGTNTFWAARYLPIRDGMRFSTSGTLASMACGLPYAIAAAVAYPDRPVIAFVGDGGLTMLIGELATVVKYGLNVKIVVVKNDSLGQIKWEQMVFLGNPEYVCDLQPVDFAAIARGFGLKGYKIEDPSACAATLREVLATPGPALVEAVVDQNEPPMPPKATLKQAAHLAESLARGTKDAGKIVRTILEDRVRELV
jgi:pyruvate dehydrogenase (quinone)